MPGIFDGRGVIVTGASSGIGGSIAVELGRAGAELWLIGQSASELATTAAQIGAAGGPAAHSEVMDLRVRGPYAALIERVGSAHAHLFAVINNAGVMYPEPIMSGSVERWQAMIDINVMAVLEGCKAAVEVMRRHRRTGHLINIGSLAARFEVAGVYGATKQAVETIGASLREELEQDDIRVATVIPGGFVTQLARGLQPAELARIAKNFESMGMSFGGKGTERLLSDPQHIANIVRYILEQPIDLNIQEVLIRPPVSIKA
jgi:NADP-dependent 3-hydroxy acid dehydrogenase YdfG